MEPTKQAPKWLIDEMRKELIKAGYFLLGQSDNAIVSKYQHFKSQEHE